MRVGESYPMPPSISVSELSLPASRDTQVSLERCMLRGHRRLTWAIIVHCSHLEKSASLLRTHVLTLQNARTRDKYRNSDLPVSGFSTNKPSLVITLQPQLTLDFLALLSACRFISLPIFYIQLCRSILSYVSALASSKFILIMDNNYRIPIKTYLIH